MRKSLILIYIFSFLISCTSQNNSVNLIDNNQEEPPFIDSLSQTELLTHQRFTIFGENFGNTPTNVEVRINSISCELLSVSDTLIEAKVPANAQTGAISVIVNGRESNAISVTISEGVLPVINDLDRYSGEIGSMLTIYGENFGAAPGKGFISIGNGDTSASDIILWEDDLIRITVPLNATSGQLTVTTDDGITSIDDIVFEIIDQ